MPLMTVAACSGASTMHAWETGTTTALCGREVLGLRSTGQLWPPADGTICRACYRAHQARSSRTLWPRLGRWLDLDETGDADLDPLTAQSRARLTPGLLALLRARLARGG